MASIADPNELNQPLAFILDVQVLFSIRPSTLKGLTA